MIGPPVPHPVSVTSKPHDPGRCENDSKRGDCICPCSLCLQDRCREAKAPWQS